jgi:hypothetical protein
MLFCDCTTLRPFSYSFLICCFSVFRARGECLRISRPGRLHVLPYRSPKAPAVGPSAPDALRTEVAGGEVGGKIYVVGGFGGERELEVYDPAADRWNRGLHCARAAPRGGPCA